MYGPFQEDFVFPPPAPSASYTHITHTHNTRRSSQLHPPFRHTPPSARHRTPPKTSTLPPTLPPPSSSSSSSSRPEFSKVYAFLGSFFDPSTSGAVSEDLESMTPINRRMVDALMHNLAVNLNSSTTSASHRDRGVEGSAALLGVPPSPTPLSFSPAPPDFTTDSPAHRFTSSSTPSFFSTPAGMKGGEGGSSTPPPLLPSSSMFTPVPQPRPGVQVHTPSDFLTSTPMTEEGGGGVEGRAAMFGGGGGGLQLQLNVVSPTGPMPLPSLDSPSAHLLSPLGAASVMSETSQS